MLSYYYVRPVNQTRLVFAMIDVHTRLFNTNITVRPVLSGHSKEDPKLVFKTDYCLMKVESIADCSRRAFCNTFDLH